MCHLAPTKQQLPPGPHTHQLEGLEKASIYVDSFLAVFTRAEVEEARNGNPQQISDMLLKHLLLQLMIQGTKIPIKQ